MGGTLGTWIQEVKECKSERVKGAGGEISDFGMWTEIPRTRNPKPPLLNTESVS